MELAVVLVVIGILTVAITKGTSLIHSARISSAKSLTAASKINEIEGLIAWYENVLPESFDSADRVDNDPVAAWNDVSSQANISAGSNQLTRTESSAVVYRTDGIGKLPSLQFTSSGNLALSSLVSGNSNIASVFVVLSPTLSLSGITMTFMDSYNTSNNALNLESADFAIESGTYETVSYNFAAGQEYIIGVYLRGSSDVFVNSVDSAGNTPSMTINGFSGLTVGTDRGGADNFTGFISEIIIFDRILPEGERRHVMSYLAKKYKIRVEGAAI